MSEFLGKRDGWWHYVRRVPAVYAEHDRRIIVRQSTKIRVADDPRGIAAAKAAAKINAETEALWRGLYLGRADEAQQRYEAARQFTRALGFDAVPAAELLEQPAEEIVARIKAIQARGIKPASDAADAALGLVLPPALKLSGLVSAYEATQRGTLSGKSEDQLQRWRTTKDRAVNLLIEVAGDLRIDALDRSHALDFRDYWQERIDTEEVEIDTANKAIGTSTRCGASSTG